MKATSNVTTKLAKRVDWALTTRAGTSLTGAWGSAPENELLCCNIRSSRTFVRSEGFGWTNGIIWVMNVTETLENKPA